MVAATPRQADTPVSSRPAGWRAAAVCALLLAPTAGFAQDQAREEGAFISVSAPLTDLVVESVKASARRALDQKDRPAKLLILDFNPTGHAATSDNYGACYNLAKYLLELQGVHTVAFVHKNVTGHLVLPVLACHEIVMASEAKLGDVTQEKKLAVSEVEVAYYKNVANIRSRNPALVLKMLDPEVEVIEATRGGAKWFIDRRRIKEEEKNNILPGNLTLLPAGSIGLYMGKEAKEKYELCRLVLESRQQVASHYRLAPGSLRDPLQGRPPKARRIEVRGELTRGKAQSLDRSIRNAVGLEHKANFLVLELNCAGGDLGAAVDLAKLLQELKGEDNEPVMTVAYIPQEAPDVAAILALGCTEIVMHQDAKFGNFKRVLERGENTQLLRKTLEGLAASQGYSPVLMRGFLEADLELHRVRSRKPPLERAIVTAAVLATDEGKQKWHDEGMIKAPGEPLELKAQLAHELGIARNVVDDPARLYTLYGLDPKTVRQGGPDWLDQISEFLRRPTVALFLIMIGITCLILELKMPGVGLPGVVAALCFVLYFWAHSQLSGQIMWLAVLLFLLGLILIGLEIFVIPGFGLTGVSGILLLLVSLALVTLEKKPETTQEWVNFGGTLSMLGLSLVGAIVVAMLLARSLPSLPYASRLVLQPPTEAAAVLEEAGLAEEAGPSPAALAMLGAIGMAVTPLRPAGMARFGEEFVDVVAEGSYVEAGARVQVIEIEGNRIAVKEV